MANIVIAQPHGFCFGITRAIELAKDTAKKYSDKPIYFFGELAHNKHTVNWLKKDLKIKSTNSIETIPFKSILIIRPHGVVPDIYAQAKSRKLVIIDATCPLVIKSHQTAKNLAKERKQIILLCSKTDHDEAVGIVGEAPEFITPVTLDQIFDYQILNPENTTVITQTTLSTTETQKAFDFLKAKYPQLTILPHICQATTERQQAIIKLAKQYHFVIIVGAPTSANSNSLRSVAESAGAISYIVDNASELNPDWFINQENIVVSSGASTPQNILDEVIKQIEIFTRH
jgi:4-hydroxy-3-methylbut-2-enyl diphosphate reductase